MDKKYAILLIVFFAAVLAVSGCTGNTKSDQIQKQSGFAGGTEGIKVSLLSGQPPSQVYAGQIFQIGVQVENKGEGKLTGIFPPYPSPQIYGYISLSGINVAPNAFNTSQYIAMTRDLQPVQKIGSSVAPGGQDQILFTATAPAIASAQTQYPLKVAVIYSYTSKAVAAACVKQSIYQQTVSGTEICKLVGTKTVEASGAPVKVTSIEELPTGFNIKVKNVGSGYAFKAGSPFQTTEGAILLNDKDKVHLTSVFLGNTDISSGNYSCSLKDNVIYLYNGEATFFCTTVNKNEPVATKQNLLGAGSEYVEQLVINLDYGYINTVSTNLIVASTGEQASTAGGGGFNTPKNVGGGIVTPGQTTGGPL